MQDWTDPLTRLPLSTHIRPWGNRRQNCIATAGEAAMALYGEHPLAERFARLCRETSDLFFQFEGGEVPLQSEELQLSRAGTRYPPNFDSEGRYWEGLNCLESVLM